MEYVLIVASKKEVAAGRVWPSIETRKKRNVGSKNEWGNSDVCVYKTFSTKEEPALSQQIKVVDVVVVMGKGSQYYQIGLGHCL